MQKIKKKFHKHQSPKKHETVTEVILLIRQEPSNEARMVRDQYKNILNEDIIMSIIYYLEKLQSTHKTRRAMRIEKPNRFPNLSRHQCTAFSHSVAKQEHTHMIGYLLS